jgi:hypothetical protein
MKPILVCKGLKSCQMLLSNTIRRLWIEHVLWTRFFIISTAFDLPDLPFVTERLLQNPVDFAQVLRKFYGEQTAAQFQQLLTDHLLIAAALVNALKAGDAAQIEEQRNLWYANAEDIAYFLAGINSCFWNALVWKELLFEHLALTEQEAVLVLSGQYEESIRIYDRIQAEALEMADLMTCGIIKQFNVM